MAATNNGPYIPATSKVPELTLRAIALGILLGIVLTAANAYLGLYAGMTVSASIPAAVLSMGLLRGLFRRGTVLENNIVQTIAASGEALAAGIAFTVPALLILGIWKEVEFLTTALICLCGGFLGIIFMIPLRRQHIVEDKNLTFPEGVACAEVLIAGEKGGEGAKTLFTAMLIGGVFKALSSAVDFFKGTVESAFLLGRTPVYIGSDVSAALLGVGFIVGPAVALQAVVGSIISWGIAIPFFHEAPATVNPGELLDWYWGMWSSRVRYLGVGAMMVSGLFSLVEIRHGMVAGIREAIGGYKIKDKRTKSVPRTEQSIVGWQLGGLLLITTCLMVFLYQRMIQDVGITLIASVFSLLVSFIFVAIGSYICGLVGSSNSPVSGVTIAALILTAGLLIAFGLTGEKAIIATLAVAGVICCSISSAGDISQDLKTGYILGATPKYQQWMEIVGAILPAFIIPPILMVLHHAYGIGTGTPTALKAPQASLVASVVDGFFGKGMIPWSYVGAGAIAAIVLIVIDQILVFSKSKHRVMIMSMGVGLYLPLTVTLPVALGGIIAALCNTRGETGKGTLFASGLIAGEAVIGVVIGFIIYFNKALLPIPLPSNLLTVFGFIALGYTLWRVAKRS